MMEQPQPMIPDYRIVRTKSLSTMESQVDILMKDGWQIVGEVKHYMEGTAQMFYRELVKLRPDQEAIDRAQQEEERARQRFQESYDSMDKRVKDLLEINDISLLFVNGNYFTKVGDKIEEGISPYNILQKLKESKHYPIDMDDSTVTKAIEGIA